MLDQDTWTETTPAVTMKVVIYSNDSMFCSRSPHSTAAMPTATTFNYICYNIQ